MGYITKQPDASKTVGFFGNRTCYMSRLREEEKHLCGSTRQPLRFLSESSNVSRHLLSGNDRKCLPLRLEIRQSLMMGYPNFSLINFWNWAGDLLISGALNVNQWIFHGVFSLLAISCLYKFSIHTCCNSVPFEFV